MTDLQRATDLFQAGRLYELVGVSPGAPLEEVKAACRAAQLRTHPDKGGDSEIFKLVQQATETLLGDECPRDFGGNTPSWAASRLQDIASKRGDIQYWQDQLTKSKDSLGRCKTDRRRRVLEQSVTRAEGVIADFTRELREDIAEYRACYTSHMQAEEVRAAKKRKREEQQREEGAQWDAERKRRELALWQHRRRGVGSQFPVMPACIEELHVREELSRLRKAYQQTRNTMHKRLKRNQDAQELKHAAEALLDQARELVAKTRAQAHSEAAEGWGKFPTLPKSDPRHAELSQLSKEYRKMRMRMRHSAAARQEEARQQADALMQQALDLLACPPSTGAERGTDDQQH